MGEVTRSAVSGIVITSVMRFLLFFAVLGVVWGGFQLSATNPAGSVFEYAAGDIGYRFFGFVMWCAAITSVVGASFTSISFLKTLHPFFEKYHRWVITVFICASTAIFLLLGNPVFLLIMAGALNGLILPVALAVLLIAATRKRIMNGYHHPLWLYIAGWIVVLLMSWMGAVSISESINKL
jgi:Mn2+/Fe2+ NRAMP family transporter